MKIYFFLAIAILLTSQHMAVPMGDMELKHCHIKDYSQEVLCGSLSVFENRALASGRQIEIKFAVIPSVTEAKDADPLVMFAGGPGQGARDMGPFARMAFSEIHEIKTYLIFFQSYY